MRVIIAGGRDFDDYALLKKKCDKILGNTKDITIVSGVCKGADLLGEKYAAERGFEVVQYPPDWTMGKHAGYVRNKQMAEYADALICFWNGLSKGSKNMIDLAMKENLLVRIIRY